MKNDFDDARSGLTEDVYSKSDVVDHTEFLESQVTVSFFVFLSLFLQNYVRTEMSSLINMSALAIKEILESAQEQSI